MAHNRQTCWGAFHLYLTEWNLASTPFVQVDLVGRTPALEVATAGPQTPLELAASVATAAPGHHHQSSSSAANQDSPGVPCASAASYDLATSC